MLIVVAIIAILIAISIPMVNSALTRAKHSTDAANERAAKALFVVAQLSGYMEDASATAFSSGEVYYYNAKDGVLTADWNTVKDLKYGKHGKHADGIIAVCAKTDGTAVMQWVKSDQTTLFTNSNDDLCSLTEASKTPANPSGS